MQITRNADRTIVNVGDMVRIEVTRPRKQAIATDELLRDDVTARHYQVGRPDALGKIIEIGAPMDFIDWLAPPDQWPFQVYRLRDVADEVDGKTVINKRFMPEGAPHPTEEAALSAAMALAISAQ